MKKKIMVELSYSELVEYRSFLRNRMNDLRQKMESVQEHSNTIELALDLKREIDNSKFLRAVEDKAQELVMKKKRND